MEARRPEEAMLVGCPRRGAPLPAKRAELHCSCAPLAQRAMGHGVLGVLTGIQRRSVGVDPHCTTSN